jgi:hypothetical protein
MFLRDISIGPDNMQATESEVATPATSMPPSPAPSLGMNDSSESNDPVPMGLEDSRDNLQSAEPTVEVTLLEEVTAAAAAAAAAALEAANERYGLRQRTHVQLNPYTVERNRYKRSLKGNPDAILKFNFPERRQRTAGENGESQEWLLQDQSEDFLSQAVRPTDDESSQQLERIQLPFRLELDDDDKSIEAFGRKLRRQEREEREKQSRQRNRRKHPFPIVQDEQPQVSYTHWSMFIHEFLL